MLQKRTNSKTGGKYSEACKSHANIVIEHNGKIFFRFISALKYIIINVLD